MLARAAQRRAVASRIGLLVCWDKAGGDLPQRRTLAEIAVSLVGIDGCVAKDRLLAKIRADNDPVVQFHAAPAAPR